MKTADRLVCCFFGVILTTPLVYEAMMKAHKSLLLILLAELLFSACQPASNTVTPTGPLDRVCTEAARTVEALSTQIVATDRASRTLTAVSFVPSPLPPTPEPTLVPTLSLPTDAALPTAALLPTSTPFASCDQAAFVDETIPDGNQFPPGSSLPASRCWLAQSLSSSAVLLTSSVLSTCLAGKR